MFTKRLFIGTFAGAILLAAACSPDITHSVAAETQPRLFSRPNPYVQASINAGLHTITTGGTRMLVYVPPAALSRRSVPLNLLLHGSARDAAQLVEAHIPIADEDGVVIVAPYATISTWDAIYTTFGPDVASIDRALAWTFDRLPVNPERIAITGFSDGATYALALGRANGDLFSIVAAYSPGFVIDVVPVGKPVIAVSHGTRDEELPFETTRDRIVPKLRDAGYSVDFRTFDGPHTWYMGLIEQTLGQLSESLR